MNIIILDMEWNQPLDLNSMRREPFPFDSEIIEFGAVKLGDGLKPEDEFKCYVRPTVYPFLSGSVARLTKIRPQNLENAPLFPEACERFLAWCGEPFCLCAWGPTDLRVLLDNMLIHGMETPETVLSCDLQRIFGREIMRDNRQCSLEKAMEVLGIRMDRAHDALNDARNTARVCERMDLAACLEEYAFRLVFYGQDRLAGLGEGRRYADLEHALADGSLTDFPCPYCGQTPEPGAWLRDPSGGLLSYRVCPEGDEFLLRLKYRRGPAGSLLAGRRIYEMSDDLWEQYQDALEAAGGPAE